MSAGISICICTRNRPDSLAATLDSIRASSVAPGEIVVADDSTDRRTIELLERGYPEVRYTSGPRRGLGANRNAAIDAATADTVLFLDDDCLLGPEFLSVAFGCLGSSPDAGQTIVTGCELNNGAMIQSGDQNFLGFQNRRYGGSDVIRSVVINATVFPRRMFDSFRFDEQLIYGYDEVDLTTRAVAGGYRIISCPAAINHHFPSPINRDYYGAHANSARLYVTFKRYRWTERRPVKALAFLVVSVVHVFASMAKENGWEGLTHAPGVVAEAMRSIVGARAQVR